MPLTIKHLRELTIMDDIFMNKVFDGDISAAINIRNEGIRILGLE